jgi:hypothetical protein
MPVGLGGRRVIFHIGSEKTGTTSLQNYLVDNEDALARHSILYPKRNLGFHHNNHRRLVASYLPHTPTDCFVSSGACDQAAIRDSVLREIETARENTILLSAEHFSSRFRQPQIAALAANFSGFDHEIVLFARDHFSLFFSAYATQVASGGRLTIEAFADQVLQPGNLYARYAETITQWEEVFGRERITVLRYSETHDILDDFLGVLGADPAHFPKPRPRRDNKSLGPNRAAILRGVNVVTTGRGEPREGLAWRVGRSAQVVARHALQAFGSGADGRWRLDSVRLNRLRAIAEADQAWLAARYGVVLELPPRQDRVTGDHAPLTRALA